MRGAEKLEIEERKAFLVALAGKCQVCGRSLFNTIPQMAHRIPKKKCYLKKYGKEIIHHRYNIKIVCSLRCNSAALLDPATHPVEAAELVKRIREDLCQ